MATIARPQFLGRLSGGPEQIAKAVNQSTRGGNYRFMYLERRKQHFEMILKFTMQESQLKMQEEQERRKMYGEMADDLRSRAEALRKINADWVSGGYGLREQFKDGLQVEARVQSASGHRVAMEEKIDKASAPTSGTVGVLLDVDDVADNMFKELSDAGNKGTNAALFIKLDQHLGAGGGLEGLIDSIVVKEAGRGVDGLPTRVAAQDFANRLINESVVQGYSLLPSDKRKIQDKVATAFGLKNADELREAGIDQTAYRKKAKAAIPGTRAPAAFEELKKAMASGETAKVAALLAAEREAAAKEMDAQAKALTEKATAEVKPPSYEDIMTKAAGRMMPEKTPLEQLREGFNKKKARSASQFLSNGMTPEQDMMLSASSEAIKTLRENDGVIPHGDTLLTTEAEKLFRMYKQGDETVLARLPSLSREWSTQHTGNVEGQKSFARDLMVHFYMLKKESEGGPGLPKKMTKDQQRREEQLLLERAAAPKPTPGVEETLHDPGVPEELKDAAKAMSVLASYQRMSDEEWKKLDKDGQAKLNKERDAALEELKTHRAALARVISSTEASDDEKNLARGFLAIVLDDDWRGVQGGRNLSELSQHELAEINRLRKESGRLLYEIPESYQFSPTYFSQYVQPWHSKTWAIKPSDYEAMGTDRYETVGLDVPIRLEEQKLPPEEVELDDE